MTEPWKPWAKPHGLNRYHNGEIPPDQLLRVPGGGTGVIPYLWKPAGEAFQRLYEAAKAQGVTIGAISKQYRPLKAQEALFYDRMSPTDTGRKPSVKRRYKGRWWWLKKGKAPVASPGTSVHGWGCACDWDVRDRRTYEWLCANAPKYGWYQAGPRTKDGKPNPNFEAWHWQWSNAWKA